MKNEKFFCILYISNNNAYFSSELFFQKNGNPYDILLYTINDFESCLDSKIIIGASVSFSILKLRNSFT